jgi:DNA topoisomerase-1
VKPSAADTADAAPRRAPRPLVYVSDTSPGLRRLRRGRGFVYCLPDGQVLRDTEHISRIRRLAIPPAYTQVWICPLPHGHLQATGRDARGRKQYRYHADWRNAREASKFERLQEFGRALPRIRARVRRDLSAGGAPSRDAVLAAVVRLLDTTLVRVGNDEYLRSNGSFGLTTLRSRHAAVEGSMLKLRFRGKSGVLHEVALDDPRVARIVRRCQALPGQELFQYPDDAGVPRAIGSADVNDYLRGASGADFTAKDFRTWHGSVLAFDLWRRTAPDLPPSPRNANQLLAEVAARLGNTVAVCRKAYVHPRVLELLTGSATSPREGAWATKPRAGLSAAECEFMAFLRARR